MVRLRDGKVELTKSEYNILTALAFSAVFMFVCIVIFGAMQIIGILL